ncbi:MAG: hypothetical protein GXP26_13105 [Planctomycetes bacterium]|nr:hypothetical protein [Planctomycetota bacterium]
MEEPTDRTISGADRSEKTAETLRSLRNQADQVLHNHRERLSSIESALNEQLKEIAGELAHDHTACEIETAAFQQQHEELDRYRQSLSQAEEEITNLRNQLASNSGERDAKLAENVGELEQLRQQCQQESQQLQQLAVEIHQLQADLSAADGMAEDLCQQLATLSEERESEASNATEQIKQLAADLEKSQTSLAATEAESQALRDQQTSEASGHENQLATQAEERAKLEQQCQQNEAEIERLASELENAREKTSQALYERDCLAEELQAAKTNIEEAHSRENEQSLAGQQQLAEIEQRHAEVESQRLVLEQQLVEAEEKHRQDQQALEVTETNTEKVVASLRDAEQCILDLSNNTELKDELDQSNRKFELVLKDVQKLKHENAELVEELAQRPEADDHESPELVSLRSERDVLASRVAELENTPPAVSDTQQEVEDLQRRFELAIEDLRDLKQENESLRTQAEATPVSAAPSQATEGLDWQAQKARLLAELEAEESGIAPTPERREELATIEGTISITDRMVAEKDQEINALKAQLDSATDSNQPSQEDVQQAAIEELFDRDDLIQAERTRLEQVQREWKDKLRDAELEMSVQRATLAREKAALEEKLANLQERSPESEEVDDGKPRRRWLSALGLKNDEDE